MGGVGYECRAVLGDDELDSNRAGEIRKTMGEEMGGGPARCGDGNHVHGWVDRVCGGCGGIPVPWGLEARTLVLYVHRSYESYSGVREVAHVGGFWVLAGNKHDYACC